LATVCETSALGGFSNAMIQINRIYFFWVVPVCANLVNHRANKSRSSNWAFGCAFRDHADFGRLFASNHPQQSRRSLFHHNIRIQGMTKRQRWHAVAAAGLLLATPSLAEVAPSSPEIPSGVSRGLDAAANPVIRIADEIDEVKPDIDLYALMSGQCRTLRVAGRDFACKAVAYFHSEKGRANFTIALDDPTDASHVISFSGENSRRPQQNLYELSVDRMLLSSRDRPKIDGLPVPSVEVSAGVCRQIGNFATRQVSSIVCSATDKTGRTYHLQFESDGSPITLRRIRQSTPTIRQDPYR
jgi:hypothetical protein